MIKHVLKQGKRSLLNLTLATAGSGMIFSAGLAQTDVQIGTGTGTSAYVPMNANYNYSYSQSIYTASDLMAAGVMGEASISKIRLYYNTGNTASSGGWTVYLGNSTKTTFTSTSDWEVIGNLTNCFSGTVTFPATGNWMEITLTTPFVWDGSSSLIIGIDENQGGYAAYPSAAFNKSDLGSNRSIYYYSDYTNPDPTGPPSGTRVGYVPNIQLEVTPTTACNTLNAANTLSSEGLGLCDGDSTVLSLDDPFFETGITYQWQSFDGANWNDIPGAVEPTYSTGVLGASTNYQAIVGCTNSATSITANPAMVVINPNPTITVDVSEISYCSGAPATINAAGGDTYAWAPAGGLDNTNTATVVANPSGTTTYTVTGTDANGCTNTAETTVIPYTEVSASAVVDPIEMCESGTPVTITVDNLPANASGGNWAYRFLEVDGVTEAQTWNTTNVFNFIPTQDSLYTFYYQVQNSACGEVLDSVKVAFAVGFGAEVTVIDYDCNNMGGSIELSEVFGQGNDIQVYANNFDAGADMSAVTMTGSATNTGDMIVVTPSATGQGGYCMFNESGVPSFGNALSVSFNLTVDQPIIAFGFEGADGITYSFGDNATPSGNGNSINGRGNKLRLSFDSAPNGTENGNAPGIYLVYGWTGNDAFGPGSSAVLAYTDNMDLWHNQVSVPVTLDITTAGLATVTVGGQTIFSNVQMPAAYMNADVSTWKHLFSAGTGGSANRHAFDDFEVHFNSVNYGLSQGSATDVPATWQASGSFTDLAPGTYHVWLAKDQAAACGRNIATVEILNTNPVVELGNDTTICAGETLTLDAGNAGSTYTWSNTNAVSQTITVSNEGSYVAYVTAPNGCLGIGTINVDVNDAPTANGIYVEGTLLSRVFTVLNANSVDTYDWDFGDGQTALNAPSTMSHAYATEGTYDVTVTLSNDCGSTDVTQQINLMNNLGVGENSLDNLTIYPNPTSGLFTVKLESQSTSTLNVTNLAGARVVSELSFSGSVEVDAANWESGVYFVQVTSEGQTTTHKVVVR